MTDWLSRVRIGVIGLGYVGLPLARAIGDVGFKVLGFDIDPVKGEMLRRGATYIRHLPAGIFATASLASVTSEFRRSALVLADTNRTNENSPVALSFLAATDASTDVVSVAPLSNGPVGTTSM